MNDVIDDLPKARFVRLKNGDDIVSDVVEMSDEEGLTIMLINPLKIIYMPGAVDRTFMQIAFVPWVFKRICSEQHFTISFEDILMISDITEDMNEYYWSSLDSYIASQEVQNLPTTPEDPVIEEDDEMNNLQDIVDAIATSRRTYH